jgi:DNA-binding transcriptional regulator YiaG
MNNKYQSEAMQVIHEDMKGMHELGIISDTRMKEFDKLCLVEEEETQYTAELPKTEFAAYRRYDASN